MSEDSAREQAQDIAYTINHALACTFVDWIGVPVMVEIQKAFGSKKPISVGCSNPFHDHGPGGHDHHKHAHHDHHHHDKPHVHGPNCKHHHVEHDHHHNHRDPKLDRVHRARLGLMFSASEIIGDFAGVIPTVLMQRFTPGIMDATRPVLRATLGPMFHYGAERSTNRWAHEHGVAHDAPEYQQHLNEIYEHEIHHLPQAAWWTGWATAFNLGSQNFFYDLFTSKEICERFPVGSLKERAIAKVGGASFSIAVVLGTRAFFPETARNWTDWSEKNLVTPLTKVVGSTIGIDADTVDKAVAEKRKYHDGMER
jgi:hypothetical protein